MRGAYRDLFHGSASFSERVEMAKRRWNDSPEVNEIISFIEAKAKRPICVPETVSENPSDG
jgi:UDP-N-acetylglucosamine acyltransferase